MRNSVYGPSEQIVEALMVGSSKVNGLADGFSRRQS